MDSLRKKGLEHEPNHHGSRHREVYRADAGDAKRILVTSLLQSVPGIGASKAVVIMRLYRIPKGRRVGGLGIRQREALVALERNEWKL